MEDVVVRGVSIDRNQAKVTVDDVRDEPGIAAGFFPTIAAANIVVDMIVQSVSEHGTDRRFVHDPRKRPRARTTSC